MAPPKLAVPVASLSHPPRGDRAPRGAAFSPQTLFGGSCPALCPTVHDQSAGRNLPGSASPVAGVPRLGSLPPPCPPPGPLLLAPLPRATGREAPARLAGEVWSPSSPACPPPSHEGFAQTQPSEPTERCHWRKSRVASGLDRRGRNPGPPPCASYWTQLYSRKACPPEPRAALHPPALGLGVCPSRCGATCCRRGIYKTLTIHIKAACETQQLGQSPLEALSPTPTRLSSALHPPHKVPRPEIRATLMAAQVSLVLCHG